MNKTSTAVELRFDAAASPSLPEPVRARLSRLAGTRMTADGMLLLFAQEHRSQLLNREAALGRLEALLRQAAIVPRRRRPTRPSAGARAERMADKARRARVKAARTRPGHED